MGRLCKELNSRLKIEKNQPSVMASYVYHPDEVSLWLDRKTSQYAAVSSSLHRLLGEEQDEGSFTLELPIFPSYGGWTWEEVTSLKDFPNEDSTQDTTLAESQDYAGEFSRTGTSFSTGTVEHVDRDIRYDDDDDDDVNHRTFTDLDTKKLVRMRHVLPLPVKKKDTSGCITAEDCFNQPFESTDSVYLGKLENERQRLGEYHYHQHFYQDHAHVNKEYTTFQARPDNERVISMKESTECSRDNISMYQHSETTQFNQEVTGHRNIQFRPNKEVGNNNLTDRWLPVKCRAVNESSPMVLFEKTKAVPFTKSSLLEKEATCNQSRSETDGQMNRVAISETCHETKRTWKKPRLTSRRVGQDEKHLRRRAQNREAAERCRKRKKENAEQMNREYYREFSRYTELRSEIEQLQDTKHRLACLLRQHQYTCLLRVQQTDAAFQRYSHHANVPHVRIQ